MTFIFTNEWSHSSGFQFNALNALTHDITTIRSVSQYVEFCFVCVAHLGKQALFYFISLLSSPAHLTIILGNTVTRNDHPIFIRSNEGSNISVETSIMKNSGMWAIAGKFPEDKTLHSCEKLQLFSKVNRYPFTYLSLEIRSCMLPCQIH